MEYRRGRRAPITLAVLQGFVPNEGDAWSYTLNWLGQWLQSGVLNEQVPVSPSESYVQQAQQEIPHEVRAQIGDYLDSARRLGDRTAELHVALASGGAGHFRPEPFTLDYQQGLYRSISEMADRIFGQLRDRFETLPASVKSSARRVLEQEQDIRAEFSVLRERVIPGKRIRGHGDYHLGQVLYTEGDFVIVDFEGEPARPLPDRYIKHSPLRDVAGMLRSFHYAAYGVLPGFGLDSVLKNDQLGQAEPWTQYWLYWTSVTFLKSYVEGVAEANILPDTISDVDLLLQLLVTEKAVYELGYELNNRPNWLKVPAQAVATSKV
jgi:maltose alpha-D-glucosyltransferase/alpha-amylase